MIAAPLDEGARRRHKRRNRVQSALLLGGMAALLAACGGALAGPEGVLWTLLAGGAGLLFAPRLSPEIALRLYGARPVHPAELPVVHELLAHIARRAGVPPPSLHYVPSRMLNAFAVGRPGRAAIAVMDGLLRHLTLRELAGVLAHEVSHVRNNDLWIMGLADVIGRLTAAMSLAGLFLLFANLPLLLLGAAAAVPWPLVALLVLAPSLIGLLQLALSRAREYDADLDAAGLTGDPRGLALALAKLKRFHAGLLEALFLPGRRNPEPSLLRTHPETRKRIARLLSLEPRPDAIGADAGWTVPASARFAPLPPRAPRWHPSGVWR